MRTGQQLRAGGVKDVSAGIGTGTHPVHSLARERWGQYRTVPEAHDLAGDPPSPGLDPLDQAVHGDDGTWSAGRFTIRSRPPEQTRLSPEPPSPQSRLGPRAPRTPSPNRPTPHATTHANALRRFEFPIHLCGAPVCVGHQDGLVSVAMCAGQEIIRAGR